MLPGAFLAKAGYVLHTWDGTFDELVGFVERVDGASAYDPSRERKVPARQSLWEFYTRLHAGTEYLIDTYTQEALAEFGFGRDDNFVALSEGVASFADAYDATVGRVTEGTDHEVPLRRELEELFKLVGRWDRERFQESLTGRERSLYRPLVGWSGTMHNSGNIELDPGAIDAVLGAYADGKAGEVNAYKWEWNFEGCMI